MPGQPISRDDINEDVKKYVQIQSEIIPLLSGVISPEAKKYYESKEISFLFSKTGLDELFESNPTADALRVYYGSHADGTTSLILVAAQLDAPGVINVIASDTNAGYQWPTRIIMHAENPQDFDIISDNG